MKRFFIIILFFSSFCLFAFQQLNRSQKKDFMTAQKSFKKGDWQITASYLNKLVVIVDTEFSSRALTGSKRMDYIPHLMLAHCYMQMDNLSNATKELNKSKSIGFANSIKKSKKETQNLFTSTQQRLANKIQVFNKSKKSTIDSALQNAKSALAKKDINLHTLL